VLAKIAQAKIQEIVTNANQVIRDQGKNITLELMPMRVNAPYRSATEYTNRPNQYYVKMPLGIAIKIKIPVTSDRMIYIPLDLNTSCENWYTGKGSVRIVAQTGPPSIEGGNIIEEIVRVKDYINNLIKSNLSLPGAIAVPLPSLGCTTIGVSPGEPPDYRFGFIAFDPPTPPRRPVVTGIRATPKLEVTFLKLKRLRARTIGGDVLYQPTENIVLETYANHTARQSSTLTMSENDEVNLNFPPFALKHSGLDALVVIANASQQPIGQTEDSAFAVWPRSASFSPGTHTLKITKRYTQPPGPGRPKPLIVTVPAYELTYSVRYEEPAFTP